MLNCENSLLYSMKRCKTDLTGEELKGPAEILLVGVLLRKKELFGSQFEEIQSPTVKNAVEITAIRVESSCSHCVYS